MANRVFPFMAVAALLALADVPDAAAQSRETSLRYSAWTPTQWSALEYRTRCDGGITGVSGGPIRWRVEFRNQGKRPVSFNYSIRSPDRRAKATFTGRETIEPGAMYSKSVSISARSCGDGVLAGLSDVRFGPDEEGTPYAQPGRKPS